MKAVVEALCQAPPAIAYATHLDIAHWPDFIRSISKVRMQTEGTVGIGTRFAEIRTMFGREATEEMTIAALDPPQRQMLTAQNHGTRYTATVEFLPEGSGTRLRLTFEGVPVTTMARLFAPLGLLMAGSVRKLIQSDLNDVAAEANDARAVIAEPRRQATQGRQHQQSRDRSGKQRPQRTRNRDGERRPAG